MLYFWVVFREVGFYSLGKLMVEVGGVGYVGLYIIFKGIVFREIFIGWGIDYKCKLFFVW